MILTVTRACNLRCSYCPTAKDGWPSLSTTDAERAVTLFADRFGGGDIKLFGGEPLLVPDVVRAAMDAAKNNTRIGRVYLSTNGLGLDDEWLAYLREHPKAVLTISMDGRAEDHRRHRLALANVPDAYDHLMALLPKLLQTPRVVITQTIAPSVAVRAAENFAHLRSLGLWRFNLLPGYYIPWRDEQLAQLRRALFDVREQVVASWRAGERLYLRNLFTWAPTPFFNSGLVVDADRTIHPSNLGLSGPLEELLGQTRVGDLDHPPTPEALRAKGEQVNGLLASALPERTWSSTLAVDRELTRFCRSLYGEYARYRMRRRVA